MRAEDFHEFTRRRSFVPYRLTVSDGRVYEIRHLDQALPLWSRVVVCVGEKDGIPDHAEHITLRHVVRLEEIAAETSNEAGYPSTRGPTPSGLRTLSAAWESLDR